jgi:hypothetical protein
MTHITIEREALQTVLDTLEENHHLIEQYERSEYLALYDRQITVIKQALAAPTVQEPVAWWNGEYGSPVFAFERDTPGIGLGNPDATPLYTTPPAQPAPVPLTDKQIEHLWETRVSQPCPSYPLEKSDWVQFARAIEASHGITKGQP